MDVEGIARQATLGLPGCTVSRVHQVIDPSVPGLDQWDVAVIGWGPTLHATHMRWRVKASTETGVLVALDPHIERQHARRGFARSLGMSDERHPTLADLGHVALDRVLLRMLDGRHRNIEAAVTAVCTGYGDQDGRIVNDTALRARDAGVDPPNPRLAIGLRSGTNNFDGETLSFRGVLPESVCSAAVGRPLAALIAVGGDLEDIADRTIVDVVSRNGSVHVTMRGDWVTLDEHHSSTTTHRGKRS